MPLQDSLVTDSVLRSKLRHIKIVGISLLLVDTPPGVSVASCSTGFSFYAKVQGRRMFWLIKSNLAATGKPHLRN